MNALGKQKGKRYPVFHNTFSRKGKGLMTGRKNKELQMVHRGLARPGQGATLSPPPPTTNPISHLLIFLARMHCRRTLTRVRLMT